MGLSPHAGGSERSPGTRRIGVFGGTFDPVHNGHITVALFALKELDLDVVLMVPARDPWLREGEPSATPEQRVEMVSIAIEGIDGLELSRVDLDRSGETYTADTLADLQAIYGADARLTLVLGADSALGMDRWKRAGELAAMCDVAVVGRPGESWRSNLPPNHPAANALYLEGPMIDISATEIRSRLASGEPLRGILPERVERYIKENGLYGAGGDMERS